MEFRKVCELHKQVLKSGNTEIIDNITDLDQAKEIIKMLVADEKRRTRELILIYNDPSYHSTGKQTQ